MPELDPNEALTEMREAAAKYDGRISLEFTSLGYAIRVKQGRKNVGPLLFKTEGHTIGQTLDLFLGEDVDTPKFVEVVLDGPPGPESGRFVETEGPNGASIRAGRWIDRGDGFWALRIATSVPRIKEQLADANDDFSATEIDRFTQWLDTL